MKKISVIVLFLMSFTIFAQETDYPLITAENVSRLQSVAEVDFNSDIYIPALSPQDETEFLNNQFDKGWFIYSVEANRFMLIDKENILRAVFADGAITYSLPPVVVIDAYPFGNGFFAILYKTTGGFVVSYSNLSVDDNTSLHIDVVSDTLPVAIWVTCSDEADATGVGCFANVEAFDDSGIRIFSLPAFYTSEGVDVQMLVDEDLEQYPYIPANDEEAIVRIGRIPLPYVVTSSLDGIVKLWNLDTGEILYEVDNGTGEPSVFGNIDADATHLVWRDNANQTLYLLDFETGENREIAPLNGDYVQWYFLNNDASVIVAVNLGGEPNVVVWDTGTGERTDLGNYRDCERPQPDMVRLTEDGTTLIIGCDTGLDIWRINQEG